MTWVSAAAFCAWLTKEERRRRKIGPQDVYRLPTDHEWSCAVGIGKDEDAAAAPGGKSRKVTGYPWGADFPPPKGAGNYRGEETKRNSLPGPNPIPGYDDEFDFTAPVGSFPANDLGLYDLGGNVWEWCQDWNNPAVANSRVLRGSAWDGAAEGDFRSSHRGAGNPSIRGGTFGFRVVLEAGSDG